MGERGRGWVETRQRAGGVRWVARWVAGGRQRSRTFATEAEARAHLATRTGETDPEGVPRFGRVCELYLREGRYRWADGTAYDKERIVRLYLAPHAGAALADLTPAVLQREVDALALRRAPSTVASVASVAGAVFRLAVRRGWLAANPMAEVRLPRQERRRYTLWDRSAMRAVLDATRHDPEWHALYALLCTTGMRKGEALALRWDDIDLGRGVVRIERTLTPGRDGRVTVGQTTKGRRRRAVPLLPVARDALAALPRRSPLLFPGDVPGQPRHPGWVDYAHPIWCARAGVPRIRIHDIRHSVATLLLEGNVNPRIAADLLGHSDTGTLMEIYQHTDVRLVASATGEVLGLED